MDNNNYEALYAIIAQDYEGKGEIVGGETTSSAIIPLITCDEKEARSFAQEMKMKSNPGIMPSRIKNIMLIKYSSYEILDILVENKTH